MSKKIHSSFLEFADCLGKLSTCTRPNSQFGCVIVSNDNRRILGFGYNGNYSGGPNSCNGEQGRCGCVHAEMNALAKAQLEPNSKIFCTASPCPMCAKLIVNTQMIVEYHFVKWYRLLEGHEILLHSGITVYRHDMREGIYHEVGKYAPYGKCKEECLVCKKNV